MGEQSVREMTHMQWGNVGGELSVGEMTQHISNQML